MPLIASTASAQGIKALRGGSSVSLSDSQGVVTISAASPETRPGNGIALYDNGKFIRFRAGVGIIIIGQNNEAVIEASCQNALLDDRFGTRFARRLLARANVALSETDGIIEVAATIQEISPGLLSVGGVCGVQFFGFF